VLHHYTFLCIDVSSSDICVKHQEKRNDARSILRMNKMVLYWFSPSHRVTTICLVLLYYAMKIWLPRIGCGLLLLWSGELPYGYGKVSISITIFINTHPIKTLHRAASDLVGRCSYWTPGLGKYLWYHH
jgi:hypothetical protein